MAKLLDGHVIKEERKKSLQEAIGALGIPLTLVIIQVGNREDSSTYIAHKKRFGEEVGVIVKHLIFPESAKEREIMDAILQLNKDKTINGIIVQIPLPIGVDRDKVIDTIDPKKDIDGLTSASLKCLYEDKQGGFIPATTLGIMNLLKYYDIPLEGKKVTLLGRSSLVGKPTMLALLNENATVTVCHSQTNNLKEHTQSADILIVAIGKPKFITHEYVSPKQIVIDVGINMVDRKLDEEVEQIGSAKSQLVGDVDLSDVEDIVAAITPVPGGVGQMTVVSLFENLLKAAML